MKSQVGELDSSSMCLLLDTLTGVYERATFNRAFGVGATAEDSPPPLPTPFRRSFPQTPGRVDPVTSKGQVPIHPELVDEVQTPST